MGNKRPQTAAEVAFAASLQEFGYNLRDWQHELRHVTSRNGARSRFVDPPTPLRGRFAQGDVADAYLAAYVLWMCRQSGVEAPDWVFDESRRADAAWWSDSTHAYLLEHAPAVFKERNLFTVPDPVLRLRPGRPKTATVVDKRRQNAERQRRFRHRVKQRLKALDQHRTDSATTGGG